MFLDITRWRDRDPRPLSLKLPPSLNPRHNCTLLSEFRKGDSAAFDRIYARYQKPILRYVRSRVSDEEHAQDLSQEIFIKVLRFREQYDERYAFSTWLWTIARNTVADHLRQGRNQFSAVDNDDAVNEIPCPSRSAEAIVLGKDQRASFLRMLKSLTRLQKRVLWMRFVHQLSYPEISRKLGISLSAVKNLAYRAKIALEEFQNDVHIELRHDLRLLPESV